MNWSGTHFIDLIINLIVHWKRCLCSRPSRWRHTHTLTIDCGCRTAPRRRRCRDCGGHLLQWAFLRAATAAGCKSCGRDWKLVYSVHLQSSLVGWVSTRTIITVSICTVRPLAINSNQHVKPTTHSVYILCYSYSVTWVSCCSFGWIRSNPFVNPGGN